MTTVQPIDPDEFDGLMAPFGPFEDSKPVVVAVSGGSDSLALTILLDAWARRRSIPLHAVTVDHGLRAESAAEAQTVGMWLHRLGIRHHIVPIPWPDGVPTNRIQESARMERYRTLYHLCWNLGVYDLFLGHHKEDQEETIAMRHDRGSTYLGLGGMAPCRPFPLGRVLRPLLRTPKERLKATLTQRGQTWIDDPSNDRTSFWRGAYRQGHGFPPPVTHDQQVKMDVERQAYHQRLAGFAALVTENPYGWGAVPWDAFNRLALPDQQMLVRHLVRRYGHGPYPPAFAAVDRSVEHLKKRGKATLGHCLMGRRGDRLLFGREIAGLPRPIHVCDALRHGRFTWFDERFLIEWDVSQGMVTAAHGHPLTLSPLRADHWSTVRRLWADEILVNLPYPMALTLPALYDGDHLVGVIGPGGILETGQKKGGHLATLPIVVRCVFSGNGGHGGVTIFKPPSLQKNQEGDKVTPMSSKSHHRKGIN